MTLQDAEPHARAHQRGTVGRTISADKKTRDQQVDEASM